MQVNSLSSTVSNSVAQKQRDAAPLSADFETFLKMLTVQMQNQDPLNPVDSADYAVQLATFSSVEQQVQTNNLLQQMMLQSSTAGLSQYASWIGMQARVDAPVQFTGSPVEVHLSPHTLADDVWLSVRDSDGFEIDRLQAPLGENEFTWAGTDANGSAMPHGLYQFSVESFASGSLLESSRAQAYHLVSEARLGPNGATLVLGSGREVMSTEVTALRQSQ
ncbi:flagellar hook capping FlgD N-terminal domain-containing protein [Shimia sp. SDUM112013]|uniref:flagellar hook capping FlgD N-terminal domain-containing protein n=1 Tax=Shimia sp. SDUM112013 TaxID=3136160 RepID=UPI0032EAAD1B